MSPALYLRLDPSSGVPLGLQIVRQIRLAIATGRLARGERLPSARDLAAGLSVNFHTVRKAYGELEQTGLLRFERGKGTFVGDEVAAFGADQLRRLVRSHLERLSEDLAGANVDPQRIETLVRDEMARLLRGRTRG